jgi:hypothetical protein
MFFYIYLILYVHTAKFNITKNLEKNCKIFEK